MYMKLTRCKTTNLYAYVVEGKEERKVSTQLIEEREETKFSTID